MPLPPEVQQILANTTSPFGRVWPPRAEEPTPAVDARTHALRRFRQFLSLLRFNRTDQGSHVIPFQVPIANILIEQPDDPKVLKFPSIAILPGVGQNEPVGLGPPKVIEETADVFGLGTALVLESEYSETLTVEVWASTRAERRALVAGISVALRAVEDSYSTRIKLPEYFDQVAEFWLDETRYIDDPDVVRGRRRAHLMVGLRVPEVYLINVERFQGYATVEAGEFVVVQAKVETE